MAYYIYDGRVFDDQDDLNDYRDVNPGGTTQRFETLSEANASLSSGMLTGTSTSAEPAQYYITNAEEANTKGGDVGGPGIFMAGITKVDEAGLKSYYDSMAPLQNTFGSYENFKNYSTEYAQIVNSALENNNAWFDIPEADSDYFQAEANLDQEALEASDIDYGALAANQAVGSIYSYLGLDNITYTAPDGTTQTADATEGYQLFTDEANQGNSIYLYDLIHGSDAYNALTSKYNVPTGSEDREFIGEDGDLWRADWNGSGYVTTKIRKIDSGFGLDDFVKITAVMFLTAGAGAAFAAAGVSSGMVSAALSNAVGQAVLTGEVDLSNMVEAALSAGVSTAAINALEQAGTVEEITEWLDSQVGEFVQLEDGQEFSLNILPGQEPTVTLPSGAVLDYDVFLGLAENVYGSPVVAEISRGLPDWLNTVVSAAEPAFEAARNALQAANVISGGTTSGGVGSIVTNVEPINDTTTIVSQLQEAIENARNEGDDEQVNALQVELDRYQEGVEEETEEVEATDPDSSTVDDPDSELRDTTTTPDTTTDTEENPPGITEEMFNDVVDRVREDGQVQTQEIIDALNALGVADLPTLSQIQQAFPELNDVSLEQINDTVSTLLSNAGLLTTEAFSEAMAGVLTPEQLATALANLPYGDAEDFIEAISNAGYATPEDVATALNNADLMSNEDFNTYMEQFREDIVGDVGALLETALADFPFPDTFTDEQIQQLRDSIVIPESATMEQIQSALDALAEQIPAAPTLEEMQTLFNTELANLDIASPQDVRDALAEFNFSDAQIAQIIDALPEGLSVADLGTALEDVVVGEDLDAAVTTITEVIGGLAIASPDDVRNILTNYGFTEAQLNQISGAVTIPPSATVAEVQQIVDSIPAGLTAEEVSTELSSQFEGLTRDISGVQSGIDQLAEDLGLSTEGLLTAISNLGGADGENLTTLQTNILTGLGDLSTNLGVDIGDVVTSVTDLEAGVAEGIEGLGLQLTGLGEGITDVQGGIEELAENLGLSTEALVLAISNLGTATGENLTGLQTSILTGLGSLADTLGVDVGEVVTSVTTLSTDVAEGIEGLEGQLETGFEGVQGGIDALAEQLGVSSEDIVTAIGNLGTLTSEELTGFETSVLTGLTDLASTLGLDIGDVVTSVTDLGTGLTENITGLSEQLTGVEEAVGGVTTAVTQGVETLAEALGVQTDDIEAAIVTLGSGLGGELTDLETNVLLGLTGLADSIGTDIGTVVDSITGVGTGLGENIQSLSDTLTEQLGAGFGGLGGQLESGFGQLGQQLGLATLGLFGLGAKQPTAQEIAAAQDKFEFKPFEETARPRQVQQVVQSAPVKQQPTALEQINQFIGRQTSTPQVKPINQGMFTGDPNRKLA